MSAKGRKGNRGSVVWGAVLVGLGCYLEALRQGWLSDIEDSWPVLLVIVGAIVLISGLFKQRSKEEDPFSQDPPPAS